MHIPDGFVSPPVANLAAVALVMGQSRDAFGIKRAPVLSLTTVFIYAAQIN